MRFLVRIIFVLVGLAAPGIAFAAEALPRSVLILDQFDPGGPWFTTVHETFRTTLRQSSDTAPISIFVETLDVGHFRGSEYEHALRTYFQQKYQGIPIGLIVADGFSALDIALKVRPHIWPEIPVVFAGIEQSLARLKIPPKVTGTVYGFRLVNSLTAARALAPNLKRIAIVGDPLEKQTNRRHFIQEFPVLAADLQVIDLTGLAMDELTRRLKELPEDTVVLYTAIYIDGRGTAYTPVEALSIVSKATIRPIVVDSENNIGYGATGGLVVSPAPVGRELAQLALRILGGEDPSNIPISAGGVVRPVFDWRQLQRFGIDGSRLPTGSEIRFRPPTAWEQYRWQILLTAMALLVQTLLIAGLFYEHRRRGYAEVEARRRMAELAHMNRSAAIGEMSASIAHEINQPLAGIVMNAGSALRFLGSAPPQLDGVRTVLNMILRDGDRASNVIGTIRAMFKKDTQDKAPININEPIRETLALLRSELDERDVSANVVLTEGLPQTLGNRIQLQQVILNLIRNASDAMGSVNGRARVLRVRSEADESGDVIVTIGDSGPGIDAEKLSKIFEPFFTTKPDGMGMGLSICRSIVEAHGGQLTAAPAKPSGMDFQIVLPRQGTVK